ncbi:uncharacterized protein LOC114534498 [Dendronephthya gigantea]|uniref:uncharacterized protein LOC114534498 n=1 Tax=Dendronephthya gigantea TaxID=151771 RepID=UPI001069CFC4|nr:uncharacterized protein LOC114534498 [Dendronephthya gigantea]
MSVLYQFVFGLVVMQMSTEIFALEQCSGNLCNHLSPKSCLDHLKRGSTSDGYYKIYNEEDNSLDSVYCDMVPEVAAAWTLVESFSRANKDEDSFKKHPLKTNAPVNEKSANFIRYRMSQPQMISLKAKSTHWRATCSFPVNGVDGRDQARGNFKDFDIMTYIGSGLCKQMEYVNIRGHECSQCTARWWAVRNTYNLAIDSSHGGCEFVPTAGSVPSEDNFGVYNTINPYFRCMATASSTTNWWFGGYQCSE